MFHMISYVPRCFYVFLSDHATAHAHLKISSLGCASTVEFTLRSLHRRSAMAARRGHTVNSKSDGSSDRQFGIQFGIQFGSGIQQELAV